MQFLKRLFVPHYDNAYRPHILRRGSLMFLLALMLLAEGALVANLMARQSGHDFLAAVIQSEIISLTNAERAQNKVSILSENKNLDEAAQAKANDMAKFGYFAHNGPDGKQPWEWIEASGYVYQYAGENLAVKFVDSKEAVSAWMASPTHRANIIKSVYTDVGVGVSHGMYKGETTTFVVQYFGREVDAVAAVATAPPPSFSDSVARQLGRLLTEPLATTNLVLGGIALLLMFAFAFAFFHHVQIQARDLLVPSTLVVVMALTLMFINNNVLMGVIHDTQAASVANAILVP